MVDTGSWVQDYLLHADPLADGRRCGYRWRCWLTYFLLRRLGVKAEAATGIALIMPWVLGFLIFTLFPFIASLYLSFTDYNILRPISFEKLPPLVGFDNYTHAFTEDPNFWPSIQLTLLNGAIGIPLGMIGSLVTAMLLAPQRARGGYLAHHLLPARRACPLLPWRSSGAGCSTRPTA